MHVLEIAATGKSNSTVVWSTSSIVSAPEKAEQEIPVVKTKAAFMTFRGVTTE